MSNCVTRIGLHIPVVWALSWVISTSVIRKKDGLMFGTNHSLRTTRERLQCSILSFPMSLRLPNLITQEETLQPLGSYALCGGLIVFLSIYSLLKHVISIALLMSLGTTKKKLFRVTTLQYASSSRNLQIEDTRANVFPVGRPSIPFFVPYCSSVMMITDSLLTHFAHLLNFKISYTKPRR